MFDDLVGWAEVFCLTIAAIAVLRLSLRIVLVGLWIAKQRATPAPNRAAAPVDPSTTWAWRRAA